MNLAKMSDMEEEQVQRQLAWWRRFEHGNELIGYWKVMSFTGRETATFRNEKTGETVRVNGTFMEGFEDGHHGRGTQK